MSQVDVDIIRDRLEARLGIRLQSGDEYFDGGQFKTLRPEDLELSHGFCVALSRSPKQVIATLRLDSYAGRLLRLMSEASHSSRNAFLCILEAARTAGHFAYAEVDGKAPEKAFQEDAPWGSLEIEVSTRLTVRVTEESINAAVIEAASSCFAMVLSLVPLEELKDLASVAGLPEGAKDRVEVNRYERSPANRAACISYYGPLCQGCGFDFEDHYGAIASGFIEVHHVVPVSQLGEGYLINPVKDLVPLCANCHAVVHRTDPPLSVEDLKSLVYARRKS